MDQITKAARLMKAAPDEGEMALVNAQALRELGAEEVFTFRLAACNNQVARDLEKFSDGALEGLAEKFGGRPGLMDHCCAAGSQTARVYAAGVEPMPETEGGKQLVLRCYMPRLRGNEDTIAAIEGGLLRECSVGVSVRRAVCSICGTDWTQHWCEHNKGQQYGEGMCIIILDEAADAYEVSLLPVPAQPAAGVVKSKRYGGPEGPESDPTGGAPGHNISWQDEALLELEKLRF